MLHLRDVIRCEGSEVCCVCERGRSIVVVWEGDERWMSPPFVCRSVWDRTGLVAFFSWFSWCMKCVEVV